MNLRKKTSEEFLIINPSKTSISRFLVTPRYYVSSEYLITELPARASKSHCSRKCRWNAPLNVPVLISAELAAPCQGGWGGSRQLVREGRGATDVPKSPGKLVPRPRELRADFARKSAGRPGGVSFYRDTRYTRRTCRGLLRGELLVGLISLSSVRSRSTPRERARPHGRGNGGREREGGGGRTLRYWDNASERERQDCGIFTLCPV